MASQPQSRTLSPEEYLALPEEKPYLEYVRGEVVQKAMPNADHIALARRLDRRVDEYVERHGGFGGPEPRIVFDTRPLPQYRLPDVAYWAPGKPRGGKDPMLPPTLAVEIRSPGQSMAEQREKCRFMREHGVDECWLIDPEARTVEVFGEGGEQTSGAEATLTSEHLPGFELALGELFAALD